MKQAAVPKRFRALDAWRGICALLVVLFHAPALHLWKDAAAFANLQLCVDFFFVLSGFVLSHAVGERRLAGDASTFLLSRARRLWPLHVAVLAAFVVLELAKLRFGHAEAGFRLDAAPFSEGRTATEIVTSLLFLQGFGLHPGLTWNGPSWSIAVEFWVSVLFAGSMLAAPGTRSAIFAGLAVGSAVALAIVSPDTIFVSSSWGILRCMLGFFTGCLVYGARLRYPRPAFPLPLAEVASALAAVLFVLATPPGPVHLAAPLLFGLVIYVFSFERGPVSDVLGRPAPQLLGRWSFSIYMTHALVFQLARTAGTFADHRFGLELMGYHNGDKLLVAGNGPELAVACVAFMALVVVPVGALCHMLVETPLNRWLARPAARPASDPAAAVSA